MEAKLNTAETRAFALSRQSPEAAQAPEASEVGPLVSVIIPCRNAAPWIAACLAAVLRQTHSALEVLVVDDGSSDDTVALVKQVSDPRLRLIQQTPAGACAARNRGLAEAQGALIQFHDADDVMHPGKLAAQVAAWRQHGDEVVYFGPYGRFLRDIRHARFRPGANWRDMSGHAWQVSCWTHGNMMAPHAWLTPARIARAAGPWDETLAQNQDGEYFLRVILAARSLCYCPEAVSYYRMSGRGSISRRRDYVANESRLRATRMMCTALLAVRDDAATRQACANAYEELIYVNYPSQPALSAESAALLAALGGAAGQRLYRGFVFKAFAQLLGWQLARRLQHHWQAMTERLPLLLSVKRYHQQ